MKLNSNLRLTCLALGALALSTAALYAANAPKTQDERGSIKSVDAAPHTLVVADLKNKSEHKFQWNDQTQFTERGKTATAADIKAGERIRLIYKASGELPTVERARFVPAKREKTATAAHKPRGRSHHKAHV